MPVEIKEMVIKGVVTKGKPAKKDEPLKPGDTVQYSPSDAGQAQSPKPDKSINSISYALKRQIVMECMQEVMDALNRRLDR